MNDEIASFLIKFVTEGLDDVKDGIKDIKKSVDNLNDTFEKSEKKGESFFGALVKWTTLVGGLTAAFQTLKGAVSGVFDTAGGVIDLYRQETLQGVEAKVLEQYGLIARRNLGSQGDAYAFFKDVNDAMFNFQKNRNLSKELMTKYADVGFSFNYDYNKTLSENRAGYIDALRKSIQGYYADPNQAIQGQLASLVKQDSFRAAMSGSDEQWQKMLAWGSKWSVLSKDENTLQAAQDLETAKIEWEQIKTQLYVTLMPLVQEVLEIIKPIAEDLNEWLKTNGKQAVQDIADWIKTNAPTIVDKIKDVANGISAIGKLLAPIVKWALSETGGSISFLWNGLKAMFSDDENAMKDWVDKYATEGGGWAGDLARWLSNKAINAMSTPVGTTRQVINNNFGGSVTVEPGTYSTRMVVPRRMGSNQTVATAVRG